MAKERGHDYEPGAHIPGTQYVVVRPIGAGGMGQVYEVEDVNVGRRFVLKALHSALRDRSDLTERMRKEARALARLNHPNIVQVFTAGVTSDNLGLPYYVMERLDGQSLRQLLDMKGKLGLNAAYTIAIELLDALDRAHENGIIHRDVKPDNLFIHKNGDGTVTTKLLDFGVMSILSEGGAYTAGRFIGTFRYAAPEQIRGERVTARTDLYAAGLVTYEMLAGRGPFDDMAEPGIEQAHAHATQEAPPLSQYADVPSELEEIVHRCLCKDPAGRPKDAFSVAAVLRRLKQASKQPQTKAPPPSVRQDQSTVEGLVMYVGGQTAAVDVQAATEPQPANGGAQSGAQAGAPFFAPSGDTQDAESLGIVPPGAAHAPGLHGPPPAPPPMHAMHSMNAMHPAQGTPARVSQAPGPFTPPMAMASGPIPTTPVHAPPPAARGATVRMAVVTPAPPPPPPHGVARAGAMAGATPDANGGGPLPPTAPMGRFGTELLATPTNPGAPPPGAAGRTQGMPSAPQTFGSFGDQAVGPAWSAPPPGASFTPPPFPPPPRGVAASFSEMNGTMPMPSATTNPGTDPGARSGAVASMAGSPKRRAGLAIAGAALATFVLAGAAVFAFVPRGPAADSEAQSAEAARDGEGKPTSATAAAANPPPEIETPRGEATPGEGERAGESAGGGANADPSVGTPSAASAAPFATAPPASAASLPDETRRTGAPTAPKAPPRSATNGGGAPTSSTSTKTGTRSAGAPTTAPAPTAAPATAPAPSRTTTKPSETSPKRRPNAGF